LFIIHTDGTLAVCQTLTEEAKAAWSLVETSSGKFKHIFCHQEKVLFIVERNGCNFIETFDGCVLQDNVQIYDATSTLIKATLPINIELELFPLLSLKKVSFFAPQLLFHKQVINEIYIYFEGDASFKVNGQILNQNEIFAVTKKAKVGRVIMGSQWNYGETIKITYSGFGD
ncbi:hypothetical protein MEO41_27475, partial [Dolichospermum sp. ST_sed4]|nr:hypothetical protein [Dolichospermum sp. ST_sed4]